MAWQQPTPSAWWGSVIFSDMSFLRHFPVWRGMPGRCSGRTWIPFYRAFYLYGSYIQMYRLLSHGRPTITMLFCSYLHIATPLLAHTARTAHTLPASCLQVPSLCRLHLPTTLLYAAPRDARLPHYTGYRKFYGKTYEQRGWTRTEDGSINVVTR